MAFSSSLQAYRALRAIDGIFFWLLFLAILFFSRLAFDLTGGLRLVALFPIFGIAWYATSLSPDLMESPHWRLTVHRLKAAALVFAGCAPMLVFWSREMDNIYLYINFLVCTFGGAMTMLQLTSIMKELCGAAGAQGLAWETRLTFQLVFWITLVGTWGGVTGLTVVGMIMGESTPSEILRALCSLQFLQSSDIPTHGIWVMVMMILASPAIFFFSVAFRTRLVLHFRIKELLKGIE